MNIQHVEGVHLCEFDKGRVAPPNRMNFRKNSKGGTVGGGITFNPKIYIAGFWNFKQGFSSRKSKHLKGQL